MVGVIVDVFEQSCVGSKHGSALQDDVLEFRYTVDTSRGAAVDEFLALDFAEGGRGDEFGEDEGADVVEADVEVAEEGADAVDVDFVGVGSRVVAVFVEEFVECRA